MTLPHVFVETNFLFSIFQMPSKRREDALALRKRFETGEIKLYAPYLSFQETRHLIGRSLPTHRCADLLDFHRFCTTNGTVNWDFEVIRKLFDAALGEVSRTKAVYQREIAEFAAALGDGLLHGSKEVFDRLESLELDDDNLKYNDKLVLSSVLVKANELKTSGVNQLFFASLDKSDLRPTPHRPKLTKCYQDVGLIFLEKFALPVPPDPPS